MTYRFKVNGRVQETVNPSPEMAAMIDAAILEFPMELDTTDPRKVYIVTNEFLFAELISQIQEAING